MTKVIVTGGAGFIGTHLVKALQALGHEIVVVDIKIDPNDDVRDPAVLQKLFKGAEYVFHLAALVSVPYSIEHPLETNATNLTGTLNVLIAARDAGVKRVIFSSSAAVYGDQDVLPVKETAELRPMSPYALEKFESEMYLKLFSEIYGLETVSLRYFNIYGEGQDPNGPYASAIPKFLKAKKEGKPLTIVGDGSQTRDFVHVSDVVSANIAAMMSTNGGKGEAINIATGRKVSMRQVAELILSREANEGSIEHLPARFEIKDSVADISKAKELLDWEPKVAFEEGIQRLL
ncbi:MAG: UDP-glucose 4-epimerase [Parcubacteria group bacterium]|nr:UDP-glucose 4-epimerase [Parcubacteria group bacterium]